MILRGEARIRAWICRSCSRGTCLRGMQRWHEATYSTSDIFGQMTGLFRSVLSMMIEKARTYAASAFSNGAVGLAAKKAAAKSAAAAGEAQSDLSKLNILVGRCCNIHKGFDSSRHRQRNLQLPHPATMPRERGGMCTIVHKDARPSDRPSPPANVRGTCLSS